MKHAFIDNRCSLWDVGITTIYIRQTKFELLSAPKRGGSCFVYEALKKESIGTKEYEHRVILKEFYPILDKQDSAAIIRCKDGSFSVSESIQNSEYYQKRLKKFLDSYEIMLELSKRSDSTDHSVTALSLTESYGTWYIEETYDSGKLIFDYDTETTPSLKDFLTTMKDCLLVVKNLHQLGYYHLDIKPDNISATKSGVIKLWDIDSLVKISEIGNYRDFMWSDGFSAPEIESASKRPEDAPYLIGPWTDIYSIAQLFCYYCFKRPLQYMELIDKLPELTTHIPRADFYITEDHYMSEYLSNEKEIPLFSRNGIYLLKHFLLRALSFRKNERYQTIDEALSDLSTIIERCDSDKLQPIDNFNELTSEEFQAFDNFEELEKLEEFFASYNNLYFASITGSTAEKRLSLAKYYATKHRTDYDTIFQMGSDHLSTALEGLLFFGQKPSHFNIQHILADLKQYCRNHKLLIIIKDGIFEEGLSFNEQDYDVLEELMSFDEMSLHFLCLSKENCLGSYIIEKNKKNIKCPFFEVSLNSTDKTLTPQKEAVCLPCSNKETETAAKFNVSWKAFGIALLFAVIGIFFAEAPDYFMTNYLTEATISSWYRPLIYISTLGPLFFTCAAIYFYDFLIGQGNLLSLIGLIKKFSQVFLSILAIADALMLSKYVSVIGISMLGIKYGIPHIDYAEQFIAIPKYILYAFLLVLLIGIPLLWSFYRNKRNTFRFLQNILCITAIIFAFIHLSVHTFQMKWVLIIYIVLWMVTWLSLKIIKQL